jgi:thioredoxin 1
MVFKEISTTDEFKNIILKENYELVVAYFTASWCGPCKQISPYVLNIGENNEHIQAIKIDVDICEELAAEYEIEAMPTFKFFKDKSFVQIDSFSGADSNKLIETIKTHIENNNTKDCKKQHETQEQTISLEDRGVLNNNEYLNTISKDPINNLFNNNTDSTTISGFSNFSNMDNFSNF